MKKHVKSLFFIAIVILSFFVYQSSSGYKVTIIPPPSVANSISKNYHTTTYYNAENDGVILTFALDAKTDNNIGHIYWGYIYAEDVKEAINDTRTNEEIIEDMQEEQKFLQEQLGDKYSDGTSTAQTIGEEDYWLMAYYDLDLEEPYVTYEINFWTEDFDINDKGMEKVLKYFNLDKLYDESTGHFTMKNYQKYANKLKFKDIVEFATEHYSLDKEGNVLDTDKTTSSSEDSE